MSKPQAYQIKHIDIARVVLNPENPRIIKDASFRSLVKSLQDCPNLFEARPLLCSDRIGDLIVIGGNMRLRAAQELKWLKVPVIVMSGLTEAQEKEIAIKDNGAWGEWDFDILANEWGDFPLNDWGVNLPSGWIEKKDEESSTSGFIPEKDPNILVRLFFHAGLWLGKREEILAIFDKMTKTYECSFKVEE